MGSSLFVSTTTQSRHAAFAIERTPPAAITAVGTGVVGFLGQLPWGPFQVAYQPTSIKDMNDTYAPPGMTRTGSGVLSLIRKAFPSLQIVRVLGATPVKATVTLNTTGPTAVVVVTAKYEGTGGNSMTATVATASDGDANHFNLTVTVTGASGTTTETFSNLNYSGTGSDSVPTFTNSLLVSAITKSNAGRPTSATTSFSGGTNGSAVVAADYVGTQGSGDKGVALLESKACNVVCCDDPGNSIRAAVNAGLQAHAVYKGDRIACINGNSGLTISGTVTDAATYSSERVCYVDPWVYVLDDVDATRRLVPPAPFAASIIAQLSPSTSPAWKNPEVQAMLIGINGLESERGEGLGTLTQGGVMGICKEDTGGYTFEAGVLTVAPADSTRKNIARRRIGDYIAKSVVSSLRPFIDAPNVEAIQSDIVQAVATFMGELKRAAKFDPAHTPHVVNYAIGNLSAVNSPASIASGVFVIPLDVQTSSAMEKIFLSIQFGEGVVVAQAA